MNKIRLHSRFPLTSTLALAAAAVVAAGLSPVAQAAGDKGLIKLYMGSANYFAYQAPGATFPSLSQPFGPEGKGSCTITWPMVGVGTTSYANLVDLVPGGGAHAAEPGFGATSLGVFDGPKGTPCSRVSQYASEKLTFLLGPDTTSTVGTIRANAFDQLELDVEVKADAALQLEIRLGSAVTGRFYLQTGSSITGAAALPKADGQPADSSPSTPVVACSARSDSGPDSGPNDNCRWVIKDIIGSSFEILPLVGEFSLEGGGDWEGTALYTFNQSVIYLTSVREGWLPCGGSTGDPIPIGDGSTGADCQVNAAPVGFCPSTNVHYFLREISGTNQGCDFIKDDASGQLAASMTVTFPPEPADLNATTVLFPRPVPPGGFAAFEPKPCTGTVAGLDSNPTIVEVLTGPTRPPGYVDVVEGNGARDWACILDQTVKHVSPGYIQVTQRILFWGDFTAIRH